MHSTQSEALHLVMALIRHKLCRVDVDGVWSLFESTAIRPTAATLCFLAMFLDENGAPEHGRNTATEKKSVRSQLLNWLICSRSDLNDEEFVPSSTHLDARLVSRVLIALTVRDARVSHECRCSVVPLPVSDIEHVCLLSTFHDVIRLPSHIGNDHSRVDAASESSVLHCRQKELLDRLILDVDYSVTHAKLEVRALHMYCFFTNFCNAFPVRCQISI